MDQRTHHCFVSTFDATTGQIYTDQTGRFLTASVHGNNYIMVLYDYDSNGIFVQPFARRTAHCILDAYKRLHDRLCRAGLRPRLQRLDNECSQMLKDYMHEQGVDYQLVPPHVHRRNAAERAIRTFKNHFIAGLCSVDPNFPLYLWDELLPQAEITLNLLRSSRINPKLSAWAQVHGIFDFNRTPLGPPGTKLLIHEKPAVRKSWSPHGVEAWYVGPALDSYRCFRAFIPATGAFRLCDTLTWFPHHVTLPQSSTTDLIAASLRDIVAALQNPSPATPLAPLTDSQSRALRDAVTIIQNVSPQPSLPNDEPATTLDTTPQLTDVTPPPTDVPTDPLPGPQPTLIADDEEDDVHDPAPTPHPAPTTDPAPALRVPPLASPSPSAPALRVPPATTPNTSYEQATTKRRRPAKTSKPARRGTQRQSARTRRPNRKYAQAATPPTLASPSTWDPILFQALHGTAINPDTGRVAEYHELAASSDGHHWQESNMLEIGRLFQGLGPDSSVPDGTNTCFFIKPHQVPKNKKPTYVRVVCADRPEKTPTRRVRWTLGGDRIDYPGNKSTKTADLSTAKLLFNSVLSRKGRRFMTMDLKDFYLMCALLEYEYIRIPLGLIPDAIRELYHLDDSYVTDNGYIYAEVRRGMYGLPQAGKLANDELTAFLAPHGYRPCPITPGLWKHDHSTTMFTLVVDDFGVRYDKRADAEALEQLLLQRYKVSTDWTGSRYVGLDLQWDYDNGTLDISMPEYVQRALQRFAHPKPTRSEYAPHDYAAPVYGSRQQYETMDDTPFLDAHDKKRVQEVVGTFLFYARAVDCTMLTALGTIASKQANPTQATMEAVTRLLNYCATNPDAIVRFHASDMQLYVESDASYLSESKARSRGAGYMYLSSRPDDPAKPPTTQPPLNGPVAIPCNILREVVSSASEAELAALFHNGIEAAALRIALEELGHPQAPIPMVTDNKVASGIANDLVKQRRSKAMDMRFYWIRDRVRQGHYLIYWDKSDSNRADYFTKHHPPKHHRRVRFQFLHDPTTPTKNYYECLSPEPPSDALSCEGVLKSKPALRAQGRFSVTRQEHTNGKVRQ
ncbi:hypothetical protein [Marinobacter shengliensis]